MGITKGLKGGINGPEIERRRLGDWGFRSGEYFTLYIKYLVFDFTWFDFEKGFKRTSSFKGIYFFISRHSPCCTVVAFSPMGDDESVE
jgi:hypothetical protein